MEWRNTVVLEHIHARQQRGAYPRPTRDRDRLHAIQRTPATDDATCRGYVIMHGGGQPRTCRGPAPAACQVTPPG